MRSTLLVLGICFFASFAKSDERPNIILIVANDIGRDWVSCYGAEHPTPNVDLLAKQGVRYETAWCTPLGSPTQVTLLTGLYPFRHGCTRQYDAASHGGVGLSWAGLKTFARELRDSGYATAIGGLWHINPLRQQPDALTQHGFDEYCVCIGAQSGGADSDVERRKAQLMTNGRLNAVPDGPAKINSFIVDFITRNREKPFLVYYPMLLADGLTQYSPLNNNYALNSKVASYAEKVTAMDQLVGKLIESVDSLGLGHNTLIVFTSNNGSAVAGSLEGKPFEAGKGEKADRGVHVPFVIRAPFLTSGSRVSRDLVDFTDFFPSFLELAKLGQPRDQTLDGRSFVPSLRGSEDPFKKRNWIFSQLGDFRMVRDWQHILDSEGRFHDLLQDPLQQSTVSPLDKIAPGRRQRLEMILKRFPADAPAPYVETEVKRDSR